MSGEYKCAFCGTEKWRGQSFNQQIIQMLQKSGQGTVKIMCDMHPEQNVGYYNKVKNQFAC